MTYTINSEQNSFIEQQYGLFATEEEAVAAAKQALQNNPTVTINVNKRLRTFKASVKVEESEVAQPTPVQEAPGDAAQADSEWGQADTSADAEKA